MRCRSAVSPVGDRIRREESDRRRRRGSVIVHRLIPRVRVFRVFMKRDRDDGRGSSARRRPPSWIGYSLMISQGRLPFL